MAVEIIGNSAGAGSFVLDVVKCLAAPIGRPFKYLWNYNTNFINLEREVDKLKDARVKVQRMVDAAKNNVEEIEETVEKWQKDVDSIIGEAEQVIQEKANNPQCFKGLCPSWITHYKHSKKAFKLKENGISQLLPQGEKFDRVSYPTIQQEIWRRSTKDYVALDSRTSTVKHVRDALNDESIYMIGVYGMGGLGKTTLVQEIGRKAMEEQLFDELVFIEVTETPNIETIQLKIAGKLGLKLDKESEVADKANKLYTRLKMSKKDKSGERHMKILLILDDIWEELDLDTVGIPSGDDRGGCKLLLTTRNRDVLDRMASTNNFKMGTLCEKEAWSLFQKMAGGVIQTRGLNSLPQDVCKECGGLPIVICTIAKVLRNKSRPFDWEVALEELRAPSPTKFKGLLEKEYQKLALSYNYLRNDELKKTFLISSLMNNDTSISNLFKHVMNLDVLERNNLTMEGARNRLEKVVRELKDSCLLLEGSRSKQFSMHDSIRAVAITIAHRDHHVFTTRNDIEKEWKDKGKLRKCTKIYLHGSSIISTLWPKDWDCPDLEFFYMINSSLSSFEIPEDFFTVMPKLKVLNLCNMRRLSLPLSLDLLTNLQTLCLDYSEIKDVAIIRKLKNLKVLSLQHSNIEELPAEFGQLTQLRLLDLSNCELLEVVAPNVISKLSQLEELYIKGCCIHWNVEALKELKHLSRLTSLEIDIEDNKMLPKDFFFKELKRCKISIGDCSFQYTKMDNEWLNSCEFSRMLEFKYDSTISLEELRIFKNVELLRLAEFSDDDNNLTPLFNKKVIFSNLMALELKVTSSIKIWDSQHTTFMSSLTRLILWGCGNIKYVFPFSIAKSLQTLQHLEIRDCEVLEEIVVEEEGAKKVVNLAFPKVIFFKLENLPKLTAFYHGIDTWELPMLKRLVVNECEKITSKFISEPKSLGLDNKINHDLEEFALMKGEKEIIWQSQSKALKIKHDESTNILPRLLQRFENLKELQLSCCYQFKELFFPNLPNLEVLDVNCCELMSLVSSSVSFQNLKVLRVDYCNGLMMKLITPSTARSLAQLRELSISNCGMLIEIVENGGDATRSTEIVFNNLKKLSLRELESLTCFCSGNYSFNFPSLEELNIGECHNIKTFTQRILSTPKLYKVNYESFNMTKKMWENIMEIENEGNDLNKTIQGAYKKQVDSNLKELTLSGRDIMSIWEGEFQESFGKVKTLQLIKDEHANIPIQILHKFSSLEELILKVSSYEEIFSFGEDGEYVGALTKLKVLELRGLFNLKCIRKQDFRLNSILQNLDQLEVQYCHNLTTLLPSSASFENLTTLAVWYCNGMENLMSSSTVKSLVQLEELTIVGCAMMMEVLGNEGDTETGEIVFEKLKNLYLSNLKSLTSFCYGNYTLKFPNLESLYLSECFKMKTFFGGSLSMPRLQELNAIDCSESNINMIIQQLQNVTDCSEFYEGFPRED